MGGPALIDGKAVKVTDNFHVCKFVVNNVEYPSSEHYYQCMKAVERKDHDFILKAPDPRDSWRRGNLKRIKVRNDWEVMKVDIMYDGNLAKFRQNNGFIRTLTSTKSDIKCRGSSGFWNEWNAVILERIREDVRDEGDRDTKRLEQMIEKMEQYKQQMRAKTKKRKKKPKRKLKKKT